MSSSILAISVWALAVGAAALDAHAEQPSQSPIAQPVDQAYPGQIRLQVDASDVERRIVHVRETITGVGTDSVLLYPKWLPGTHSPIGPIDGVAGLVISADGKRLSWARDPVDVYAFRVKMPPRLHTLNLEFDYLSPTSSKVGRQQFTPDVLILEWNEVVFYPAGYFSSRIPVDASVTLPDQWAFASPLETASSSGATTEFKRASLESLVDSPVYAGRYTARIDLVPGAGVPVRLNLFADRPESLVVQPAQLESHRNLVQQAYKLFGSHHFAHYDFLLSLSEEIPVRGLEHHQSSSNSDDPKYFVDWDKSPYLKDLLPHELVHSWNGKFRRPRDLWTPNLNVPMQDSLLWVYEGQTQYWGTVLAARSGLWSRQQALDELAMTAAYGEALAGRRWRSLQDTTNDPLLDPAHRRSWPSWQRFRDYYQEGALVWLDVDTLIRQRSHGKRSLDDFARAFFGIKDGDVTPVTYTFEDIVKALNDVEPYDWAGLLRARLERVDAPAPLDGLRRGGYRLTFTEAASDFFKSAEKKRKRTDLLFSIGLDIDEKEATIVDVLWDSPAFNAKLTESTKIVAVNGSAYSGDILKDAIKVAAVSKSPVQLIVKTGDRYRVARVEYYGGLRYPHLERDPPQPALLDDVLAARK
jgi:predicted metalloprotease with PDZ domain